MNQVQQFGQWSVTLHTLHFTGVGYNGEIQQGQDFPVENFKDRGETTENREPVFVCLSGSY